MFRQQACRIFFVTNKGWNTCMMGLYFLGCAFFSNTTLKALP